MITTVPVEISRREFLAATGLTTATMCKPSVGTGAAWG
jgi:hypothetical protein